MMKNILNKVSAFYGSTPEEVETEIQNAITIAWDDPAGRDMQLKLFPEGKPSSEQFIKTIVECIYQKRFDVSAEF